MIATRARRAAWPYSRVERLVELLSTAHAAGETLYRRYCDRELSRPDYDRRAAALTRRFRSLSSEARKARRAERLAGSVVRN